MRVAEAQLCFNCLSRGHQARFCRRNTFCSVTDCGRRHHPLVHSERRSEQSEVGGAPAATVATAATAAISPNRRPIAFSMLKATLMGHNGMSREALVFVDPGSDVTLVSSKLRKALQLKKGRSVSVPLSTVGGEKRTVATEIEGRKLTNELTGAQWTIVKDRYPHLRDLPLQDVGGEPDLLLGLDHVELLAPREVRMGRQGEPIAEKNLLGWAAKGPIVGRASSPAGIADSQGTVSVHFLMAEEEHRLAHRFFNGEALGTEVKPQPLWSNEDQVVLGHLEKNIQKLDGQPGYMVKLPWRPQVEQLGSNLPQAEQRWMRLRQRLSRDSRFKEHYEGAIQRILTEGFAREIYTYDPSEKPLEGDPRLESGQFFLPHQGVYKNERREKLRVVFDASAQTCGLSLNKVLFCGPKLQTEVTHVLTRFREFKVAFRSDIQDMFARIHLHPQDAKKHRFLFQKMGEKLIRVYQMDRLTFGDGPSPCVAIATLRRTARDFGTKGSLAVESIEENFYVDDWLESVATLDVAESLAKEVDEILKQGNFQLTKWLSNDGRFSRMEANADRRDAVLGVFWDNLGGGSSQGLPDGGGFQSSLRVILTAKKPSWMLVWEKVGSCDNANSNLILRTCLC
ncbi:uncharacterized protein LOC131884872 [Tigriopus californicus]|uniref:uncharacterized protein LOC131884872 n=1 Tax=Tigriopus californicus TaxID=6832 RepID=UPI0027DA9BFD|nr:uncharacterized protein LOC131884872 [Tigriopus californicus]